MTCGFKSHLPHQALNFRFGAFLFTIIITIITIIIILFINIDFYSTPR